MSEIYDPSKIQIQNQTQAENRRLAWEFVEAHYPNYHGSNKIYRYTDNPDKESANVINRVLIEIYEMAIAEFVRGNDSILTQLSIMEQAFAEKRSDVTEILCHIINGEAWDVEDVEHRYISARLPDGREVVYDTLTTLMSLIDDDGEYHELTGHAYYDDRAELDVDTDPTFFEGDPPYDESIPMLVRQLRETQALIRTVGTAHTFDGSDFATVLEVASDKLDAIMEQLKERKL